MDKNEKLNRWQIKQMAEKKDIFVTFGNKLLLKATIH